MKCKVCNKELYGSPVDICRSCYLDSLEDKDCPVCGRPLSKLQIFRGFTYCSHKCHGKSEDARSAGVELNRRNREENPWWNYKNFIRYPGNKLPYAYLYVVSTVFGVKVGISMYFYKRIEEITRCKGNRSEDSYIHRVYLMNTLDAAYLESYIHRVFKNENEYHYEEDLNAILGAVDNPLCFTSLNGLKDERNPDLNYDKVLVFRGTYDELEMEFKLRTRECNLSKWTVNEHRESLYPAFGPDIIQRTSVLDDHRLFELHDGLITHNCRLRLDLRELTKRNGGLFGSGDSTGSVGVVTINLPRLAYEASNQVRDAGNKGHRELFYEKLYYYMDLARESLQIKRKYLEDQILARHLLPAFETYVGTMDNHFSTIGLIGMSEMCENLIGVDITNPIGKEFALEVLDKMRARLSDYQEEDVSVLWNLEATPAESTSYRLAMLDLRDYPDIAHQGPDDAPYYTNSCHIPVKKITGIKELFDHQDDLQCKFTGGTVVHMYCGGPMSAAQARHLVCTIFENYSLPYISISPVVTLCETHGHLNDNYEYCPKCGKKTTQLQRITGYIRDTQYWNKGKKSEYSDRRQFREYNI